MIDKPSPECEVCDFKNAVRYGRADHRCPNCGKQLMLEMVLMAQAGIDYTKITPQRRDRDGETVGTRRKASRLYRL